MQAIENFNKITLKNNKSEYTQDEIAIIENAWKSLEVKAQGGQLTIEETRIRIAYLRLKQEENFRIVQPTQKATGGRKKKENNVDDLLDVLAGETVAKPKRISKKKENSAKANEPKARAARLLAAKDRGEILSEEDELFLEEIMCLPIL